MSTLFGAPTGLTHLDALCEDVQVLCIRVGNAIKSKRKTFSSSAVEEKDFNNLVSHVDREAEEELVKGLENMVEGAGFITEENDNRTKGSRYNWVIDPLDGTTNFIHGVPCYSVSVALTDFGKPVLGVIYEINQQECFYAWKDGGAFMNGEAIHVSTNTLLKRSLIATGFPYAEAGLHRKYVTLFGEIQRKTRGVRRPGSAATDMAWTAAGRFDAFYEYNLSPWDVAAGIILVKEAGGLCTDFSGGDQPIEKKQLLCGSPDIHAELLKLIQKKLL